MSVLVPRLLRSGVLALWAVVLGAMIATGRINAYLHPAFQPWTLAAAIVLGILALLVLLAPETDAVGCLPAEARSLPAQLLGTLLLTAPLLTAFLGSESSFSATTVRNRTYVQDVTQLPGITPVEPALPGETNSAAADLFVGPDGPPKTPTGEVAAEVIDLLYAAQVPEMRPDFENHRVQFIGQLMPARHNNPHGDRYDIIRMFMTCCAADAQPVAVTVEPAAKTTLPEMSWVKVTGTATFPVVGGQSTPLVKDVVIEKTDPPQNTLIY